MLPSIRLSLRLAAVTAAGPLLSPSASVAAETAPAAAAPNSPAVLPGRGLAQHPFFYAGEWYYTHPEQKMVIVRDGQVVWSYSIPLKNAQGDIQEYSDATLLSNGNVLFARKTGAGLVTPDHRLIWNYDAPKGFEVHIAQPLGLTRAMLIQNGNPAKMMIVDLTTGRTEKEMVLPTGNPLKTHPQFRRARLTAAGTLLAAHMDNNKVAEYDLTGKEIWSIAVPAPWAAVRLKNGNTLVTSNRGFVREYNPQGRVVWELTQADVPDIKFFSLQEADRLANGDTVISNWCPNGIKNPKDWPTSVQVLEVTPDKKVVWALRAWDEPADLGPATVIQLLDEPGVPEKGEQQR
jgi:PQQ-like domain